MKINLPSSRRRRSINQKLNIIPILSVIFILFLALFMSTSYVNIFEIAGVVQDEKSEATLLTLSIQEKEITLTRGNSTKALKTIKRFADGKYDLMALHSAVIEIKKNNMDEDTIVLNPVVDLSYEEIVAIMDSVRMINKTDEVIMKKNKEGVEEQIKYLFSKILFSNLMS